MEYPDMVNEIIHDTYIHFENSTFIDSEIKQIL